MFINDFPVVLGVGYEILVNTDAQWTPDVYTNRGGDIVSASVREVMGTMAQVCKPDWSLAMVADNESGQSVVPSSEDGVAGRSEEGGEPCLVRGRISGKPCGLSFKCYVLDRPGEVLNQSVQSCGVQNGRKSTVWWAELGNLPTAWRAGDEVVVLVCNEDYYGTVCYRLDGKSDMVKLSDIVMEAVPEVKAKQSVDGGLELSWEAVSDPLVIGYSVYQILDNRTGERLNNEIIKGTRYGVSNAAVGGQYELRLVFAGGWESGFYTWTSDKIADGIQSGRDAQIPAAFTLSSAQPNPFSRNTLINFAVAQTRRVELKVYDVAGKLVRTLKDERLEPGYYAVNWDVADDMGRLVGAGVYFCKFAAGDFDATRKLVVTK